MNPISSGSQTPKRRWQEPQLPSQRWPGEGGLQGCDDKGRWLLPHSPQSGGGGAAEGCRAPAGRGRGGAGCADSVRAAAAAPGSIPAICLSLRPDGGGGGAPRLGLRAPPAPGVPSAGPGLGPQGASSGAQFPLSLAAPGALGTAVPARPASQ